MAITIIEHVEKKYASLRLFLVQQSKVYMICILKGFDVFVPTLSIIPKKK